jgi:hypothetical protein
MLTSVLVAGAGDAASILAAMHAQTGANYNA